MANENIEVGTRAVAKVGRNEISVEVIAVENGSFLVRNDAGREFHVAHLTVPDEAAFCEDDAPNPAPECAANQPQKKLSLFDAVVTALQSEPAGTAQHPGTGRSCRRKGFVAAQRGKDSGADTLQRHLPGKRHQRKSPNRQKRQKREVHLRRKINSTHFTKGCHQYGHPFVLYIHRLHRLIEKSSKTCKNL